MKKILLVACSFCFTLFGLVNISHAHDIPPEILEFLSANPDATEEEFNAFILDSGILGEAELFGHDEEFDSAVGFTLPETLVNYLLENPDATPEQVQQFVASDPELAGSDVYADIESWLSVESNDYPFSVNDLVLLDQLNQAQNPSINWAQFARNYIRLGIEHILIGLDHILFVISLILVLLPWGKVIKMITIFTLAHSVTLLLAGTDLLRISGSIVEPIIALSIAYVAITTVFFSHISFFGAFKNKLWVIFLFGLFHGMGFAGVFADYAPEKSQLLPSVIFFNVGVEIGQILILLLAIPLVRLVYRLQWNRWIIPLVAVGISGLALVWFVERVFLV